MTRVLLTLALLLESACAPSASHPNPDASRLCDCPRYLPGDIPENRCWCAHGADAGAVDCDALARELDVVRERLQRHAEVQAEVLAAVAESKADNVWWQRGRGPTRPCPPLPTATTLRGGRTP